MKKKSSIDKLISSGICSIGSEKEIKSFVARAACNVIHYGDREQAIKYRVDRGVESSLLSSLKSNNSTNGLSNLLSECEIGLDAV